MSPRRKLPAGIHGREAVFTYTGRDHTGWQYSRKAGNALTEAEAFERRIDKQLTLGSYRPASSPRCSTPESTCGTCRSPPGTPILETTMRYDRARKNLDRHPNYVLAAYMAWAPDRLCQGAGVAHGSAGGTHPGASI